MGNGDKDSGQGQVPPQSEFGTKITIDLGEIELTSEQSQAIQSDIINVILQRMGDSSIDPRTVDAYRRGHRKVSR